MSTEQTDVDHGFYIDAVVQALKAAGLTVAEYEAMEDELRDAYIQLAPKISHDTEIETSVVLTWHEERGWQHGFTRSDRAEQGIQCLRDLMCDGQYLHTVALPTTVADAVLRLTHTVPESVDEALAAYLPAAPIIEPEPDPSDPRQIVVSLMLDAARELNDIREALPDVLADLGIALTEAEYEALIDQLAELAETADITIGWSEVGE